MNMLADLLFVAIVTGVGAAIAFAGAVRAGVLLIVSLLAGLLAMNWFEALSDLFISLVGETSSLAAYSDFASLVLLFLLMFGLLFFVSGRMMPSVPELPVGLEFPTRWLLAVPAGWMIAAFLFTALHAFPASRDFGGFFPPEPDRRAGPLMQLAPDYQWLKLTDHVSTRVFSFPEQDHEFGKPTLSSTHSFPSRYAAWREQFGAAERPAR